MKSRKRKERARRFLRDLEQVSQGSGLAGRLARLDLVVWEEVPVPSLRWLLWDSRRRRAEIARAQLYGGEGGLRVDVVSCCRKDAGPVFEVGVPGFDEEILGEVVGACHACLSGRAEGEPLVWVTGRVRSEKDVARQVEWSLMRDACAVVVFGRAVRYVLEDLEEVSGEEWLKRLRPEVMPEGEVERCRREFPSLRRSFVRRHGWTAYNHVLRSARVSCSRRIRERRQST